MGSGYCSPEGCLKEVLVPITSKSTSKTPVSYACFLYDQTRDFCPHWLEAYEAAFMDLVGDKMHIQEGILSFTQHNQSFIF